MKKLLQVVGLAVAWSACGQGVTTNQALNVTGFGSGGSIPGINLMGWSFTPTVGMAVIEMGFFTDFIEGQTPISVGLWAKDTGILLKSVQVDSSDPLQQVTYLPVDEISLTPFQVYYIGAYTANSGGINVSIMDNVPPPDGFGGAFTVGSGIQVGAWATNSVSVFGPAPVEVTDQNGVPANGVVPAGANFRYRVPEPSSLWLSCLAGLALLALRRRRDPAQ
jgi:hypothetical protein